MSLTDKLLDRYAELIHNRTCLARDFDKMVDEKHALSCKVSQLEAKVTNLEGQNPGPLGASIPSEYKDNAGYALHCLADYLATWKSAPEPNKIALIKLTRILRRQAGLDDGLRHCKDFIDSYM